MKSNIQKLQYLNKARLLIPLVLVEAYLLLTLLLLYFGPIIWKLDNPTVFAVFILLYHLAFISGFCLYYSVASPRAKNSGITTRLENFVVRYYWVFMLLALVGSLINYRHFTLTDSYIPYNFFKDFYEGLVNPGLRRAYTGSDLAKANFNGNFAVSLFYGFISFARYGLVPVLVSAWGRFSFIQRASAISISLIPLISGVSIGTNKPIFDTLFLYSTVLFFQFLSNYNGQKLRLFKYKRLILLGVATLCFTLVYFNHSMSQRSSSFNYMEDVSTPGDIVFKSSEHGGEVSAFTNAAEKITVYVAQGYYGMSLAISEDFDSTFGIGHSSFLLYQARDVFGVDLFSNTYQYKISDRWDQFVQWHSFYSQVANDVGFLGVTIVMLALGIWFSVMCHSAIVNKNILAKCILPFAVIMFFYMPANNQVFNFMDTTIAFLMLNIFWVLNMFTPVSKVRVKALYKQDYESGKKTDHQFSAD